ncbi:MAG: sigma-70 family RNA polymerase sigma factor [Bacteroidota bacterium]
MAETCISDLPFPEAVAEQDMLSPLKGRALQQLLYACWQNEETAQTDLYQTYYRYAMSVGLRYAPSKEDAEEIVNDSFIKVFSHLKQQEKTQSFKSWMRRILINTAIDYHRKNRAHNVIKSLDFTIESLHQVANLEGLEEEELLTLISNLPPSYQQVFTLHAIEGYKHHEVADQLGISVGTSKSHYAKARKRLQRMLSGIAYER